MAYPTVQVNSSGSDTLASGAGPSTAVTGTAAATASNTTVTITDAVALGGVATDGSAALWVATASGRRWARITAISGSSGNWTVTVSEAYGVTASGQSWAIGGKRATLDGSTQLGLDMRGGWTVDVQSDQTTTANFRVAPNAVAGLGARFTSTNVSRPTITTATNNVFGLDLQGANFLLVSHLRFTCTAGTPGYGVGLASNSASATNVIVSDCYFSGWAAGVLDRDPGSFTDVFGLSVEGVEVTNCGNGIDLWAGADVTGCYLHGNSACGLTMGGVRVRAGKVTNTIIASNGSDGMVLNPAPGVSVTVDHCSFYGQTTSGKAGLWVRNGSAGVSAVVTNNAFYGNATNFAGEGSNESLLDVRNNAFGGALAADVSGVATTGANPVTLTADPFTSSSDFTPNSTAGGGAALRNAGTVNPGAGTTAGTIGAVPAPSAAAASFSPIGCGFIQGV